MLVRFRHGVIDLPSMQINDFFHEKETEKIELMAVLNSPQVGRVGKLRDSPG